MKRIALCLATLVAIHAHAEEVIPPKPANYFNDYAGVISPSAVSSFNRELAQFERTTSNQIVVAVFQKMQSDDDVAAYAQRVADSWGIGTKAQRNGVLLIVFIADRKISIQVGYGLEGALPDITAYDIRTNVITPRFRSGDYTGGLAAGIVAIEQAIRGEYKGSGKTIAEQRRGRSRGGSSNFLWFIIFFIILNLVSWVMRKRGGYNYSSRRSGPVFIPMGFGGGGGGGWSPGGGGGFGGFSGGGGSFGGGGSSGSW